MKLASLKVGGRDGTLVLVSRDLSKVSRVTGLARTLQEAIEDWEELAPHLVARYAELEASGWEGASPYNPVDLASPLPRAFQWADGSAYLSHMRLVRKARGAELPPNADQEPLMYQGGSDSFLGPVDAIPLRDPSWGLDFEAEIAVITDDVPAGVTKEEAYGHVKLVLLCNDISLREIMRPELQKGFGFFQSKPASAFSPTCCTPDELGDAWDGGKVNLPLISTYNGSVFGRPNAGVDLSFDFGALIAHAAMTRSLAAGTIIGSGTVSNNNYREVGSSCLAEARMIETIASGSPITRFMQPGDTIRIEMIDAGGRSVFGAIDQQVVAA
jgi:fumarylacetoacetate (FAA) hydrolase